MSQPVGSVYKSRIPSFSDDASIVEALKVYHYGVDDWTTQPIPNDSVEGNFRTLNTSITNIQSQLSSLNYVQLISQTSSPNVVTGQSVSTTPITIRSIVSQTAPLLQLQNSSSVSVGSVSTGGFVNLSGYLTVGSTTQSINTGINIVLGNSSHKGVVVKAQSSQTANMQEWQSSSGVALSWVDKDGRFYYNGDEISGGPGSFFLMGA
jgi:hypothetical protein